jgi:hypothetical protein
MEACISNFTFWETMAKLAPIGTASIALIAASIALCAIWVQMHIARRRAAIDFFLKTEVDDKAIDLYNQFREHGPSMTSIPTTGSAGTAKYRDIRAFLNICELIAVGVRKGVFSKSISRAYWGDIIPDSHKHAKVGLPSWQAAIEVLNSPL